MWYDPWSCFKQVLKWDDFKRSLPTWVILWCYDLSPFNPSCKTSHPFPIIALKSTWVNDSSSRDWRWPPLWHLPHALWLSAPGGSAVWCATPLAYRMSFLISLWYYSCLIQGLTQRALSAPFLSSYYAARDPYPQFKASLGEKNYCLSLSFPMVLTSATDCDAA